MNESAVLLVGDLAWPVTILVIVITLLVTQRGPVGRLIDRIKSVKYPGGEAELSVVAEAGVAVLSTAVESLRDVDRVPLEAGEHSADGAAPVPIPNREPVVDVEPLALEEVTSLVALRARTQNVLEELAFPPPPGGFGGVTATLETLRRRGVLESRQASALGNLIDIAGEAMRGAVVSRQVGQSVQNNGLVILEQLDKLRKSAGRRFEDHALDTLRRRLPDGWLLESNRAIPRDPPANQDGAADPDGLAPDELAPDELAPDRLAPVRLAEPRLTRVDALVTAADRSAVVEIRARLQPGADGQLEEVREWLAALPPDLPVLLVMLGERITDRELRWMRSVHEGPVELLLWDREADELIMTLRELLRRSGVRAGLPAQRTAG